MTIIMKPTNQCNLRCKYCYHADNGYSSERMSDAVLEKTIKATAPFVEMITYNWHGGEPLLMGLGFYEKAIYYQNKYRKNINQRIRNTMQTNGILMTSDFAQFIKEHHIGIGISYDAQFNETIRGKTDKTLRAYNLLKEIGVMCGTITVIGNHNAEHLIEIYNHFKELNNSFKISPMFDSGAAKNNESLLINTPADYSAAVCKLFDYWVSDDDGGISIRPLDKYMQSYFNHRMRSCTRNNCLYHMAAVYSDGTVYPCGRSYPAEYILGNIQDVENITELFNGDIYKRIIHDRNIRDMHCKTSCDIYDYCRGGCNNDCILSGDILQPDKFQCVSHKQILNHVHKWVRGYLYGENETKNICVQHHLKNK